MSTATTVLARVRDDDSDVALLAYWHATCGGLHITDAVEGAARTPLTCGQPPPVRLGVWRHRAGGQYLVLGVAHDDRGGSRASCTSGCTRELGYRSARGA